MDKSIVCGFFGPPCISRRIYDCDKIFGGGWEVYFGMTSDETNWQLNRQTDKQTDRQTPAWMLYAYSCLRCYAASVLVPFPYSWLSQRCLDSPDGILNAMASSRPNLGMRHA